MSSSESVGVSLATVSDGSTHAFDGKMLSKLIAAVSASLDTLTSIKVFLQAVDSSSFMRAAERFDMATATVSDLRAPCPNGRGCLPRTIGQHVARLSLYCPCGKSRTLAIGLRRYRRKEAGP
jgi:hypothetical protein